VKKTWILLGLLLIITLAVVTVAFAEGWNEEKKKEYEEYLKEREEERAQREMGEGDMPDNLDAYNKAMKNEKEKQEKEKQEKQGEPDDFSTPETQKQAREKLLGDGHLTAYDIMVHFPEERLKHVEEDLNYPIRYNDYYPSQYSLELVLDDTYFWEIVDTASNTGHFFIHQIINSLWQYLVVFDFQIISYAENAYSTDIVDAFADVVGEAVRKMAGFSGEEIGESGLWGELSTFLIILAGAWAAYMLAVKRATTKAWSGLGSTLVVLVLSLALFANASGAMKYMNDISSGLSREVLGLGIDLTPKSELQVLEEQQQLQKGIDPDADEKEVPEEATSFLMADRLYELLIYEPYLLLQYGKSSEEITPDRAKQILQHKVMSQDRAAAVKKEVSKKNPYGEPNYMMTTAGTFERFSVVILLWTTHIILGIGLLIIAAAILFYQLLFIILTLFAPIALLMALVPSWTHVALNWVQKWAGAILMKLMLSIFLTLILAISQVLYRTTPPTEYGYIWTITLQLILVVGILWKRKDIFDILRTPVRGVERFPGETSGTIRSLPGKMRRGYQRTKYRTRRASRSTSRGVRRAYRAYNLLRRTR